MTLSVRLDPALEARVDEESRRRGVSKSEIVKAPWLSVWCDRPQLPDSTQTKTSATPRPRASTTRPEIRATSRRRRTTSSTDPPGPHSTVTGALSP